MPGHDDDHVAAKKFETLIAGGGVSTIPDPRIDALKGSAILRNTRVRLTFAPTNREARVVAVECEGQFERVDHMQSMMQLGRVHLQLKAGFGAERSIELSGPELLLILQIGDQFITNLPIVDDKKGE